MIRHSSAAGLALAILAVLGLTGPAAAQQQVPFKGNLEGVVTITPVMPPNIVDVVVSAGGNATDLGRFTLAIPHRVDRGTVPPSAVGTYRFTAANGDFLTASFTGKATPTATPGVLAIVETGTITGGAGRYAGATGGFVSTRLL